MSEQVKVLVIVEGNRSENNFCKSMAAAYSLDFSVYCLGTNIYSLYKRLEEYDFNADIKKVLEEVHPEYAEILSQKFTYTYLFFDLDPHHPKKEDERSIENIVKDNMVKVREMSARFTDETDPTVGKLYINYPMLESYRDCDTTFDPNYKDEYVSLKDIALFKQHVATKQMVRTHLDKFTANDFNALTKMNVFKLNHLLNGIWGSMCYSDYLLNAEPLRIIDKQTDIVNIEKRLAVLNTSLFFLLDYFGNQTGFYDRVMA